MIYFFDEGGQLVSGGVIELVSAPSGLSEVDLGGQLGSLLFLGLRRALHIVFINNPV